MSNPWGLPDTAGGQTILSAGINTIVTLKQILNAGSGTMPYQINIGSATTVEITNLSECGVTISFLSSAVPVWTCLLPQRKSRIFHFPASVTTIVISIPYATAQDTDDIGATQTASFAFSSTTAGGYIDIRTSPYYLDIQPVHYDNFPNGVLESFATTAGATYQANQNPSGTGAPTITSSAPAITPITGFGAWRNWSMLSTTAQTVTINTNDPRFNSAVTSQIQLLANTILSSPQSVPITSLASFTTPATLQFTGFRPVHFV